VTLEQLAWAGACDSLLGEQDTPSGAGAGTLKGTPRGAQAGRRTALWQLGLATPAATTPTGESTQLALPLELPTGPRLRPLGRWQRLIADYSTSGVTVGEHALAILRERLAVPKLATSAQLMRLPTGWEVALAGLVIARQRPGTAGGTMFLLFEDEFGTVNLIVPKLVYERHRQLARAEPLLLARGRLERSQEGMAALALRAHETQRKREGESEEEEEVRPVINVIVRELEPLERFLSGGVEGLEGTAPGARVHHLPAVKRGAPSVGEEEELQGADVGSSMRAAAPPVQSFAAGRRR
jgi:error-prone DNA polymerase